MTREEAYRLAMRACEETWNEKTCKRIKEALEQEPAWIPIKTRPLTEEEKAHFEDLGYDVEDVSFMYDCPLPDEGQEVLVSLKWGEVSTDTFCHDYGMYYFEGYCDEGTIVAWML